MTIRVAINGMGRIGRCVVRAIFEYEKFSDIELVAVNGSAEINTQIHLLKYDSIHSRFSKSVSSDEQNNLIIDGKKVRLINERDPKKISWSDLKVDVVFECTGAFTKFDDAMMHIKSGAKKVLISAPAKENSVKTIVYGVNHHEINNNDQILSVGSCTTNCLAPIAKVLNEAVGIEKGFMTTIHAYTNDQNIVDNAHKDLRRARACALSMIPTSTGAAKAIGLVLPELNGKLDGVAVRVPTANVSMVDLNFISSRNTSKDEINAAMKKAAENEMKEVLCYVSEPLVSIDFNHTDFSSSFDATQTKVIGGNMVKVCSWYDNEWAFSLRMLDIANFISKK